MKPIKRVEINSGKVIGKPVKYDKDATEWMNEKDADNQAEKELDAPKLNFSSRTLDPPETMYQDQGDSVQSRILRK